MSKKKVSKLWVERYRPSILDDIIFQDEKQKEFFTNKVTQGDIPNLLFAGVQGTGKTTLSLALMNELNVDPMDVMLVKCSDETGVDNIRDNVSRFAETMAIGEFKVVRLEECLDENTPIVVFRNGNDTLIPIKEVDDKNDLIKSFNMKSNRVEYMPFTLINSGQRTDIYEVELETGEIIKCTANHKWFVENHNREIIVVKTEQLNDYMHIISPI